jgi:hypothetical protein
MTQEAVKEAVEKAPILNDALENALANAINSAMEASGEIYGGVKAVTMKTIDFLSVQAPDVVHQFLVWKMWEALIPMIIWAVFVIASWVVLAFITEKGSESREVSKVLGGLFGIFSGIIVVGSNIMTVVKIWVAPKVYLLEYATEIIRKVTQ